MISVFVFVVDPVDLRDVIDEMADIVEQEFKDNKPSVEADRKESAL